MAHQSFSRFLSAHPVRWLVPLTTLLLLLCSVYLLHPYVRARYLVSKLQTLELGQSTFEDAQRLARQMGARPNGPCDRSSCEWDVKLDNSKLPRWWAGQGEAMVLAFDVKNNIVVRKSTGYGIGKSNEFSPSSIGIIEQEDWGRVPRRTPVASGWTTSELYRYYEFTVFMTPKASAEDRRRYTSLNFNCFWQFRGCKDARELLPTADPANL